MCAGRLAVAGSADVLLVIARPRSSVILRRAGNAVYPVRLRGCDAQGSIRWASVES
jgi:hypothetical protein